jgi:repressor LexA
MFTGESAMEPHERQQRILEVIEDAVKSQGYPPTVREIGAAVGLCSPASVQGHLTALEEMGYIRRGSSKRRALEVVRPSGRAASLVVPPGLAGVPLVGRVAAGVPLLAEDNIEESLEIPRFLGEGSGCFALRVAGTSMINAGILDGDIVVVRQQETADDGDIVVALLEDEATLKRFFREADLIRLQPENDAMEPILTRDPRKSHGSSKETLMDTMRGQERVQTLGACLSSLGPGDACPCCGGRLEARVFQGAPRGQVGRSTSVSAAARALATPVGAEPTGDHALQCPECGCEIDAEEGPLETKVRRALNPAA